MPSNSDLKIYVSILAAFCAIVVGPVAGPELVDKLFSKSTVPSTVFTPQIAAEDTFKETNSSPVCRNEVIPQKVHRINSENYDSGVERVVVEGVNGTRKICELNGTVVSSDVIFEPVTKRVLVGVGTPEPVELIDYSCPVTTCNDGTCSNSTGRGTCSWHGGVNHY